MGKSTEAPAPQYDLLEAADRLNILDQQIRSFEDQHFRLTLDLDAMEGFKDDRVTLEAERDNVEGRLKYTEHMLATLRGKRTRLAGEVPVPEEA